MSLLAFENVSKSYGATPALENVSPDIPAGKNCWSPWPNGSGKQPLIKLINGLFATRSRTCPYQRHGPKPSNQGYRSLFAGYDPISMSK